MIQPPTIPELAESIVAELESKINQQIPYLPKAWARVLAKVLAGVVVTIYLYCSWILLQMFPEHASFKEVTILGVRINPLVAHGRLLGVGDPHPPTQAQHTVSVTVLSQTGNLEAGTQLMHVPTGVIHSVVAPVALDASTVTATIVAVSDPDDGGGRGTIGNLQDGSVLEFANPPPQVAATATVTARTVDGVEGELESAYRSRVTRKRRRPPQGGAYADYWEWGMSVPGAANIYPYVGLPGQVDVYVEAVPTGDNPDGIPATGLLEAVEAAIDLNPTGLASRRPVNAAVNVIPITRTALDVELVGIEGLDSMDPISEALDDYLRDLEPHIEGLSAVQRKDRATQGGVAGVVQSVATSLGGTVSQVRLLEDSVEIFDYALGHGEKVKLGTLSVDDS